MKTAIIAIGLALLTICATGRPVLAQEQPSAAEKKQLFRQGAKLWPVYCSQCHNARPGSEKAPYEWDQIIMHMRELGNMPPEDARALVEYLKAGG